MFRRLINLIRGMFGLQVTKLEKMNPEALLELEKENLRKQIANYNQGLAAHAGLCERLMAQVKKLEGEEHSLRSKTTAHLRAGNKAAAGQYALRLQTVSAELKENRTQLGQAESTYKELVMARDASIKEAQEKITQLRYSLDDLKVKRATAELTEMASGMISKIGGAGDTLDRLHQMVEEERQVAAGRARVARDTLDTTDLSLQEAEQQALADRALADFAAQEGIPMESEAGTTSESSQEAPRKTMGPQTE